MNLDTIKDRLGGAWYDEVWCAGFSWFALQEGGHTDWWYTDYHKIFFSDINSGWLEMYPEPKKEPPSLADLIVKVGYVV